MFFRKRQVTENDSNRFAPAPPLQPEAASVIAAGTKVTGDIEAAGDIRIDGAVQGEVRGRTVTIGHDGSVEGEIVAESVTVEGKVKGPVFAGHIHLGAASTVEGDLSSDNISIDKGASLVGAVWPKQAETDQNAKGAGRSGATLVPPSWSSSGLMGFRPMLVANPQAKGTVNREEP